MRDAYIVEAIRTPVGKNKGGLSHVHPTDLAAFALEALVDRAGVDPAAVDDVILGCANQIGGQAANVARTAWLSAGLPETVPATTVDRRCGSSQQAVEFAAQGIIAGVHDLVVAGGVRVDERRADRHARRDRRAARLRRPVRRHRLAQALRRHPPDPVRRR